MNLSGARVLVTGAAGGIGQFVSDRLLQGCEKVVAVDIDADKLAALPDNPKLVRHTCNLTDPDQVDALMTQIFDAGGINVVINNAGIIHNEPLLNLLSRDSKKTHRVDSWRKVIDINLNSVFYVTSSAVSRMVAARTAGVVVNISSIAADGNIGQSAYSATKAAVEALTKTWAKELGMFKIRCVCLAPGFIETPSTRASLAEHVLSKWEKSVPLNRLGTLDEIFNSIRFLIENDYYNGKILKLDGGLTL